MSSVTIIGAGVAGLTIGYQLARPGLQVAVVERESVVGGLARTWHYGDFHFDIGPHRFHTENARVAGFIRTVLGADAIEISRRSGVRMFGRFHQWPLRPSILVSMPPILMVRGAKDLLLRERMAGESFEADVVNKYGRTLYEIFFKPYTEKFLFYSPADLHRDWGRAGVNRAVIDKRAAADNLWTLLRNTLMPKPVETTFLYAPHGVGVFPARLAEGIREAGGRVIVGREVRGIETSGARVAAVLVDGERLACDDLVWTAPLGQLNRHLGLDPFDLEFLSTICYNVELNEPLRHNYQWTYFGGDEIYSRISAPIAFATTMAPAGQSSLCVELTCREGDERWRTPERFIDAITGDLVRTDTIGGVDRVRDVHIERVANTYPVYKLGYLGELTRNLRELGRFENLLVAGRCGRFWYNNMDHSIGQGLTMADRILRGDRLSSIDSGDREFWADKAEATQPQAAEGD